MACLRRSGCALPEVYHFGWLELRFRVSGSGLQGMKQLLGAEASGHQL